LRAPWRVALGLLVLGALASACSTSGGNGHKTGSNTPQGTQTTASTSTTSSTLPATAVTTSTAATSGCVTVSATSQPSQGAAGTIVGMFTVVPVGVQSCTLVGYPSLIRYGSGNAVVPVHVVNGLTVNLSGPATQPAAPITITAAQPGEFTYQYSDVPTGSETTCAASSTVSVVTPGQTNGSTPVALDMAPCNGGTIEVSPFYLASAGG
jgi:hypothetical protein